ncbi:hypothetical protein PQX77_016750, partial [Marasmius sp. AFHP31]
ASTTPTNPELPNVNSDVNTIAVDSEGTATTGGTDTLIMTSTTEDSQYPLYKAGQGVTPEDVGKLDNKKTIQSALSFCEGGKAGRWAANYLKQANASTTNATVQFPFEGKWEVFEKQFKVRFSAANEKVDAIRELEHMKQGSKAVTVYSQDFWDAGAKTGLSYWVVQFICPLAHRADIQVIHHISRCHKTEMVIRIS